MKLHSNRLPQSMDTVIDTERVVDCSFSLLSLPTEVLITLLSYVGVTDVKQSVKHTCKGLYSICNSQPLWREFCQQTGKLNFKVDDRNEFGSNYMKLYRCTPCVPVDYPNLMSALSMYHSIKSRFPNDNPYTITLMPGLYHEQIDIDVSTIGREHSGSGSNHHIRIRAAFPEKGAAIAYYDKRKFDKPTVSIRNRSIMEDITDDDQIHDDLMVGVTLEYIQFLHHTRGSDIWNGNCAIQVDGLNLTVTIVSCSIQSDSGRGLVATRGAHINIYDSNVHDCAATGVYVGDLFTSALFERCNIIRNGGGTRHSQGDADIPMNSAMFPSNMDASMPNQTNILSDTSHSSEAEDESDNMLNVVPPGHSGMYIETSTAIVRDCLIMSNSLTGLSVVRGGLIKLSQSDILDNGSDPITIEDAHDVLLGLGEGIRGGVDDLGGNLCCTRGQMRPNSKKNFLRCTNLPGTNFELMTIAKLNMIYN